MDFFHIDLFSLVRALGYAGLAAVVFAESGLFFGFFFPGDSLLFTAGLIASGGYVHIGIVVPVVVVSAIAGDSVGYWFGARAGPKLFTREDSFFFHKNHALRTRAFYEKYGARSIVLARFIPIVRTFAPILAGVGSMRYKTFLTYNIIGGTLWGAGVTLLGFFLGAAVPESERYILPIVIGIIALSFLPILREALIRRRAR